MHQFVLQDWVTIRGNYTIGTINQNEDDWIDLEDYQDLTAWIDIRELTLSTGTTQILVNLQTSPLKDEFLFVNMVTGYGATGALTAPVTKEVIMSSNPTVPVGRWVRWQLVQSGGTAGVWDITFRILLAAHEMSTGGGKRDRKHAMRTAVPSAARR